MRKHILVTVLAMSLTLISFAFGDESTNPKYYDNAKVVRVRHVSGEGMVKRSYDDGFEEATVNLPLFENDEVTTTDGRVEIYLGRLNYLRLDSDTHVRLSRLPYPQKTDLALRVEKGGVYLEVENLDFEKGIEVQTPDCGIFLLDRGSYRVNVMEGGRTEVFVHKGLAEVSGTDVSRNVRENQKLVMASGEIEQRPFYFYSSDRDDFDSWNEERNRELGYAQYGSARYLQAGYEDYEYELSHSGRWSYMDEFHEYCWIPYDVDPYWRPYYNGRWVWNPFYGYVWSSYDSWGWFTHYYGRWHWHNHWGWYWIPSYHWSPAWVSWWWDDYYYGWCPLSWWNTPVIVLNNHWDRSYNWRHGLPNHGRSSIIIRKGELINPNIRRAALSGNELASVSSRSLAFRGNAPADRPAISRVAVLNGAGKPVLYKQSGIVSENKYQIIRSTAAKGNEISPTLKYKGTPGNNRSVVKYSGSNSDEKSRIRRSAGDDRSGDSSGISKRKSDSSSDSGSRYRPSSERSSGQSSGSVTKSSGDKGSSHSSSSSSSSGSAVKKKKDEEYYSSRFSGGDVARYSSSNSSSYSGKYSRKGGIAYSSLPGRNADAVKENESRVRSSGSSYGYVSRSQSGGGSESRKSGEGLAVLTKLLSGREETRETNTSSRVAAREYSYPSNSSSSSSGTRYEGQPRRGSSGMEVLRNRYEAEERNFRTNDYRSVRTSPSSSSDYSSSYAERPSIPSVRYRSESSDRGSSSLFGGISHRSSSSPSFGSSSSSHSSSVSSHSSSPSSSGHSASVSSHSSSSHSSGGSAVRRRN